MAEKQLPPGERSGLSVFGISRVLAHALVATGEVELPPGRGPLRWFSFKVFWI